MMSENTHTLEPWENFYRVIRAGDVVIATVWSKLERSDSCDPAIAWVFAQNIAAAPDLLMANELSEWVAIRRTTCLPCPYHERHGCRYPGYTPAICVKCASEVRCAAIAKATKP